MTRDAAWSGAGREYEATWDRLGIGLSVLLGLVVIGRTERHAVLIGVDYQGCQSALSSQGCPPGLEASVNDVEALQRLLIDRYQFRPGRITVLVHQNATKPKILTTLAALRQTTTAALMEGLSGKADDTKTGRITVTTLDL